MFSSLNWSYQTVKGEGSGCGQENDEPGSPRVVKIEMNFFSLKCLVFFNRNEQELMK